MTSLPSIADRDAFTRTRESWHAVAEHVLAAARYRAERRIGLVVTPGGFGTPVLASGRSARVSGGDLVVIDGSAETTTPLTTLAAAAAAIGVDPGSPPVYPRATPLELDVPLAIDAHAARVLASWFDLAWSVLGELGADLTLWPEHFDVATELGDEARGGRGTFGASPGDAEHPEPYLYVTHWADVPNDEYWNDVVFDGASLGYAALADGGDPHAVARAFFARGRAVLLNEG